MDKYEWIATEKQYFGQPNTAYDFSNSEPREVARRLQKLQETKEKLSRNVNMRAMNMLSKAEEKVRGVGLNLQLGLTSGLRILELFSWIFLIAPNKKAPHHRNNYT